jgi:hypothetical protein
VSQPIGVGGSTDKDWRPVRIYRRRRGREAIDVPHLRGGDIDTQRRRRLFVRADQARRRRTAAKEARLNELRERGFDNLTALKRALSSVALNVSARQELENLYRGIKAGKESEVYLTCFTNQ